MILDRAKTQTDCDTTLIELITTHITAGQVHLVDHHMKRPAGHHMNFQKLKACPSNLSFRQSKLFSGGLTYQTTAKTFDFFEWTKMYRITSNPQYGDCNVFLRQKWSILKKRSLKDDLARIPILICFPVPADLAWLDIPAQSDKVAFICRWEK